MSDFGTELARLMTARGVGVRELARMVPCNPGHISNLRSGKVRPSAELAEALDERLEAGGTLRALARGRPPSRHELAPAGDDSAIANEIAALDLVRQAEASQLSLLASRSCRLSSVRINEKASGNPFQGCHIPSAPGRSIETGTPGRFRELRA